MSLNQGFCFDLDNDLDTTYLQPQCESGYSYVSKNVKLQQADFLINISSLDILKTLLHKC